MFESREDNGSSIVLQTCSKKVKDLEVWEACQRRCKDSHLMGLQYAAAQAEDV
jgi:hypothetical protein